MVICLERGADLHMAQLMPLPPTVSCFSKIQTGFTFLLPAHPGSPGRRAVKRVCVCVCRKIFSKVLMVVLVGCDCRVGSVNCCCLSTTSPMPAPYRSASSRRATSRPRTSTACPVCPPYHLYSDPCAIWSEMTMGQRVTGHGSSGSTNLSGSRGSRDSTCDPLTHDLVNKIPRTGYFDV